MAITPQAKIEMANEYLGNLTRQHELRTKMREAGIDIDALERAVGLDNGVQPQKNVPTDVEMNVKLTATGRASPGETLRVLRLWVTSRFQKGQQIRNKEFTHKSAPGKPCSQSATSAAFHQLEMEGIVKHLSEGLWEVL